MYKIGIDIGIASVGYSVIETDIKSNPLRIINFGTRIFDVAENTKNGNSLAAPRREARGARRRNRRRKHRLERIKKLLVRYGIVNKDCMSEMFSDKNLSDIYQIRNDSLTRALAEDEFVRLLVTLAKRRGFKSNRKNEKKKDDDGKLLSAISENVKLMEEKGYKTVGEMLFFDETFEHCKRNKNADYKNTVTRTMLVNEIKIIFEKQRELGNVFATDDLMEQYLNIFESQRSFEEGPGGNSPYGGNQIEEMVGKCTFFKDEPRASKASYTFEKFTLLQKINDLRLKQDGSKFALTALERSDLLSYAHEVSDLTYTKIRKRLNLPDSVLFDLTYGRKETEEVEKAKFVSLKAFHEIRKALDKINKGYINNVSIEKRNEIAYIFTVFKTDTKIREELCKKGFNDFEIEKLIDMPSVNFKNFGNLSVLAMEKIVPYMENGARYNDACTEAGFDFRGHFPGVRSKYLPKLPADTYEITSPVVKRAIGQTIKVINAIIKEYGSPAAVNIELAREVSKQFMERREIEKKQKENRDNNIKIKEKISGYGIENPTALDVLKLKLWEEQDGICPYTGTPLKIEDLFKSGYCEIDHIIPQSISFDDRYLNKVLVHKKANQEKKDNLPLDYVVDKERFITWVNCQIKNKDKRANLLKEDITDEDKNDFRERNLQDTKHAATFLYNYINDNLEFDKNIPKKKCVTAVNGNITGYVRKRWGILKMRSDGDLHHAVDAIVIACISDSVIQKITRFINGVERDECLEDGKKFPEPWVNFKKELEIRMSTDPQKLLADVNLPNYAGVDISAIYPPFVSRMRRKKYSGAAHKETVRGVMEKDGISYSVSKTPLKKLTLENGEIKGYFNKDDDRLLYNLLKKKLIDAGGKAEKAFETPVYKPTPKGGISPVVKKVKIMEKSTLNVKVNSGIADNDSMVRIDVFFVPGEGYYFVPIYVSDMVGGIMPNKAVVAAKSYENWKKMEDKNFIFSLFPNDLIKITAKRPIKFNLNFKESMMEKEINKNEVLVYYKGADISTGAISVILDDDSYGGRTCIKTLLKIEKYYVDVLGRIYKAPPETRSELFD